jgi:glycosyltransferase involved in cell wall biosynthesis
VNATDVRTPASPRVSIITPVFNAGRELTRAIASVVAQSYADREMVIVDDGSTDARTLAALADAEHAPGVTVIRTPNRGPAAARNLAIEHARGAYILPLDADDTIAPAFLAKTVPVLDTQPEVGVVYTWVGLVGGHHGVWRTGGFSVPELLSRCTIHVSSLFRREMWTQVGGFDSRFVESCEDWDFWLGAAARGWQGHGIPEVLAYYRRSPASRERQARAPGPSARLMRSMVEKHRTLYEHHLEEAMVGMYVRLSDAGLMLERIYHHPAVRILVRLRSLFQRPRVA